MIFFRLLCIVQLVLLGHVRDSMSAPQQATPQPPKSSHTYMGTNFTEILHYYNDNTMGDYSDIWHFCPDGMKATGFALKTKPDTVPNDKKKKEDDVLTVVTGLAILCGENGQVRATSEVGKEGTWGPDLLCCDTKKSFLTSAGFFVMRAFVDVRRQNIHSMTKLIDNIDFKCVNPDTNSDEILYGYGRTYDKSFTNLSTDKSWELKCNTGICGVNTRADKEYTGAYAPFSMKPATNRKTDPSGLNEIRFVCCPRNRTRT